MSGCLLCEYHGSVPSGFASLYPMPSSPPLLDVSIMRSPFFRKAPKFLHRPNCTDLTSLRLRRTKNLVGRKKGKFAPRKKKPGRGQKATNTTYLLRVRVSFVSPQSLMGPGASCIGSHPTFSRGRRSKLDRKWRCVHGIKEARSPLMLLASEARGREGTRLTRPQS